jgi:hypothetical protein
MDTSRKEASRQRQTKNRATATFVPIYRPDTSLMRLMIAELKLGSMKASPHLGREKLR